MSDHLLSTIPPAEEPARAASQSAPISLVSSSGDAPTLLTPAGMPDAPTALTPEGMADAPTLLSASSERLEKLIADLKALIPQARWKAAEELGALGDERAVAPLCAALSPADWQLAVAVANALGKLKSQKAVDPLVRMLGYVNLAKGAVLACINALGALGDRAAIPALLNHLKSADAEVASAAGKALQRLGGADPQVAQQIAAAQRAAAQRRAQVARQQAKSKPGSSYMIRGALIGGFGLVATIVSYSAAPDGGTYYIFWGAILWGIGLFIYGAIKAANE